MKSTELRIGNWVYYNDEHLRPEKHAVTVSWMDLKTIHHKEKYQHYNPIPLTTEWLERFGFENSKTQDKFFTKGNSIGISTADNKFRFIQGNFVCQLILREIEFVHSLQNLYFALTGEELTILK